MKHLLHSLAIIALAFFAGKGELLTAQSGDIKRSHPDPFAEGMTKTKGYEFRSIDYPGGELSQVYDFNGKTAVGCVDFDAFAFNGSSYVLLNVPGAINSCGYGINISGQIVGEYSDSSGIHGFLYDGGSRYATIDYPGATITYAYDINDAGLIVGSYLVPNSIVYNGFVYDKGTFTAIDFPGADETFAYGINSSGDIVGLYDDSQPPGHGFLLSNGVYSSLDFPYVDATFAQGINDAGTITGYYVDKYTLIQHGFTYADGMFTTVDVTGASATELWRIKNNQNVVGFVQDGLFEYHGIIGK
jgi:uncharacterized membrane protein